LWSRASTLDRLARSTRDLLNVLESVKQAGAGFRSLKDTWADTTTPHGQLMLTILGGLAEFERTLIRSRTGEGRERAKARGVRFGRPKKLSAHQPGGARPDRRRRSRRRGGAHVRDRPRDCVSLAVLGYL
jgi:DNA invertase Pin-like site-specific DNA recombinase